MNEPLVSISEDVMGGAAVFEGSHVPVSALLENLDAGVTIDEFIENFPIVSREQVVHFLEDKESYAQLAVGNKIMRENRELLAMLAKS